MINLTIEENEVYAPKIQNEFEALIIKFAQEVVTRICPILHVSRLIDLSRDCDRAYLRVKAKRELRKQGLIK